MFQYFVLYSTEVALHYSIFAIYRGVSLPECDHGKEALSLCKVPEPPSRRYWANDRRTYSVVSALSPVGFWLCHGFPVPPKLANLKS